MQYNDSFKKGRMIKIMNSATKKIRVAQIIFFLIQIFLTTFPYQYAVVDRKYESYTVLDMLTFINQDEYAVKLVGFVSILFILIPVIALGFQIFDRFYNLKNIAGIICSFVGVMLILTLDISCIDWGAIFAILLYLLTFFMSVMGVFARYLKVENVADKAPE